MVMSCLRQGCAPGWPGPARRIADQVTLCTSGPTTCSASAVLALCLYDARIYAPDLLELASAAHPWTMRDGHIVANPLHSGLVADSGSRVA
ncbi:MAG TPA: hypothetical protein VMM79_03560 [Longimicrobiales bacterium]|nr:hypothetical protein [Longimicrobiales bacterium]